ncbi:F0F1 ATP synthase subunit A [Hyphomonas chukchiensis]|jgi:F-type H+-transporting ATPase subunit a|uniref:ATP synthase subunit a n=3 Tax=Hyphomonadaceae TaxID=69657 RepID=A0A062UQ49_9PROT|nr:MULTISPECIES: F0F1 ATP synthase subunit A [Hyphomonas]KCZ59651.1 F0F1 ATP synthase subunit A [Hyphomonas chukchiensis]KDA03054.1 F0F1 ATP synthase subunit A [Hyphomonas oceanitis SCH89]
MNLFMPSVALDPIHQFKVTKWLDFNVGGIDLSFTNASGFMALGVILTIAFFGVAASKGQLVPSRLQSLAEIGYGFVADMVRGAAGEEGLKFFPFVFTLFFFLFFANMIGMVPYAFTTTSHIIVTGALALLVISIVIGFGFYKNGFKFLKLFAPSGAPWPIYIILIPIEIISFFARPLTLSLRLFANMLAGHIMLKLFAGFAVGLIAAGGAYIIIAPFAFAMGVALNALELLVAGLQAYVFAILTCVYLNDAFHPAH